MPGAQDLVYGAACGNRDAAVACGGAYYFGGLVAISYCYEYDNDTSWSTGNSLNNARYGLECFGEQTAAVSCGGYAPGYSTYTEEYDGISWTDVNPLPSSVGHAGSCGSQIAGLNFGGTGGGNKYDTNEYDGISWSAANDMITGRYHIAGNGTNIAALSVGGTSNGSTNLNNVEEFNGTCWSNGGNIILARRAFASVGEMNDTLAFGGYTNTAVSFCEVYDGSAWTAHAIPSMLQKRFAHSGFGVNGFALACYDNDRATETYTYIVPPTAVWRAVNDMNTTVCKQGSSGGQTDALSFGGGSASGSDRNTTEKYDGISWSAVANMNTSRNMVEGCGVENASMSCGGADWNVVQFEPLNTTEEYDSVSWSASNNLNTARYTHAAAGLQSAAVAVGGFTGNQFTGSTATSEEYNGSTWAAGNDANKTRVYTSAFGKQNSSVLIGGDGTGTSNESEEYDGISWSNAHDLNYGTIYCASTEFFSTNYTGMTFCGTAGGGAAQGFEGTACQGYDGTSWTDLSSTLTGRLNAGGCGMSTALSFGGSTGSTTLDDVEEYGY